MLPEFLDSKILFQTALNEQLYRKLVLQLQKDFALANIDVDLSSDIEPAALKTILHEKIYYLILEKFTVYLNLLYVVDVPEKAFKEIHGIDAIEVAKQVSFLVLKREFQKVWLRAKYF